MNEALVYFLLGTVVSVPAGIAATLLTPGVQRWLDNRATKISRQRLLQLKQQFHQVDENLWQRHDLISSGTWAC